MSINHPRLNYFNICIICKNKFHPFCRKAKYCSGKCKGDSKKLGKEFHCFYFSKLTYKKRKLFGKINLFYCSKLCKDLDSRYTKASEELKKQAHLAVANSIDRGELLRKPCEICG